MQVIPDTPIWSLAFRRRRRGAAQQLLVDEFAELIRETRAVLLGPIRQEILSGIAEPSQFDKVKEHLRAFDDLPLETRDHERAAEFYNLCRNKGIQGSHIDFLICAAAERHRAAVFTTDKDFTQYARIVPVTLYSAKQG